MIGRTHAEQALRGRSPQLLGVHLHCDRDEQIGSPYGFDPGFRLFRKL
jgi:hypothetical protein